MRCGWGEKRERGCVRRWRHLQRLTIGAIRKAKLSNCLLKPHVATTQEPACEWVSPHQQQLEDHYAEAEIVMVCSADDTPKSLLILKFRCSKCRNTDLTKKQAIPNRNLERVAINQSNGGLIRDRDAAVIDITDDASRCVYFSKRFRYVDRSANEKPPICVRKFHLSATGVIEGIYIFVTGDSGHDETARFIMPITK